jgi:seryl-tRNA synthetase
MESLPNLPHDSVPAGAGRKSGNVEVRKVGTPRSSISK